MWQEAGFKESELYGPAVNLSSPEQGEQDEVNEWLDQWMEPMG